MTKKITFAGETKSIRQWADEGNVPLNTVYNRMHAGWSIFESITKPVSRGNTNPGGAKPSVFVAFEGKQRSCGEIAKMTGYTTNTIRHWVRTGQKIRYNSPKAIADIDEHLTSDEYILRNMQLSMSDLEIEKHLMRGMK